MASPSVSDQPAEDPAVEVDPACVAAVEHGDHAGDHGAGVTGHPAPGLDQGVGPVGAERVAQEGVDRRRVAVQGRGATLVRGGEATAEVDEVRAQALGTQRLEDPGGGVDGGAPRQRVALLRADVEADAGGSPARARRPAAGQSTASPVEQPNFRDRGQSEPFAGGHQAAEHAGTRSRLGHLPCLLRRVDDEEPDPGPRGRLDVGPALDGVGEDQVLGRRARGKADLGLGLAGDVEAASGARQGPQQDRVRVGLHRVVHGGAGQRGDQRVVPLERARHAQLQAGCHRRCGRRRSDRRPVVERARHGSSWLRARPDALPVQEVVRARSDTTGAAVRRATGARSGRFRPNPWVLAE